MRDAAKDIAVTIQQLAGKALSPSEESWLCVHIAARQIQDIAPSAINADDDEALVNYILRYINTHYNYNLLSDEQLHADLLTHIKTMITRVRYQIMIPNPLLDNIKQHYPMAWDMTLAAVSSWGKYTPYVISENEIGFLVLHIGVGLERHYNIGYQRQPRVLLVCDAGNAMVRMIEAVLQRKYPQIEVTRTLTLREYEQTESISEDFVISTARVSEKSKPVVMIAPFPTDYQLEQIGKLVLVDRTRPWMLDKYFDAAHFRILNAPVDQQTLFRELCVQLEEEGFVGLNSSTRSLNVKPSSAPCSATASRCRTPLACWRRKRWSIPCSPRTASSGATKPPTSSSCSPSAKANTKRRWRSTIFSSPSCANVRCHGCVAAEILPSLRRWRWRV
ncbi:PTS modulated transcriptional regulator MtlR family protein [Enterobacter cloacae]|uniref:PTS modulated transcriptional regulator MtlR family protein n=1 Tax=Enterobacter cloacae TaxID=550 RepID=A0A377M7E0_ENTCL|nr:PTS modulated transcriptional regulator MtlR family protein [Enterobacter cloacae]